MTKIELAQAVLDAKKALAEAEAAFGAWESLPENNVFATLADAEDALYETLRDMAHEDCEGAGNCGADKYTRDFMVDGKTYTGTLTVEYNRKTYYYIESAELTVSEKV